MHHERDARAYIDGILVDEGPPRHTWSNLRAEATSSEGASKPRANQRARKVKARSVSVTWFSRWRMLHLSGA
jgi:hypothetical protein